MVGGALSEQWYEPASQPSGTDDRVRRRSGLVHKAVSDWKSALVDLGGRNNLLHYRDLKRGTLDLGLADREVVGHLLIGKTVRVSSLFLAWSSASRCCAGSG